MAADPAAKDPARFLHNPATGAPRTLSKDTGLRGTTDSGLTPAKLVRAVDRNFEMLRQVVGRSGGWTGTVAPRRTLGPKNIFPRVQEKDWAGPERLKSANHVPWVTTKQRAQTLAKGTWTSCWTPKRQGRKNMGNFVVEVGQG